MTPSDLQRIRSSPGARERRVEVMHGLDAGSVVVKRQRDRRSRFGYRLLDAAASLFGLPLLRSVPAHGGRRAQDIEVRRLRELAAAGIAVPEVLHVDDGFFVERWFEGPGLDRLLRRGGDEALTWWQRGAQLLLALHAQGQAASQAFTRNFIAHGDALVLIDFEDDPLEAMRLPEAQARDWLAFLHSTARECPPAMLRSPALAETVRAEIAREPVEVCRWVAASARRLAVLRRFGSGDGQGWRRHLRILQVATTLALDAVADEGPKIETPEVPHARHH
jgi:tRNA A-37 threonylcarbamoyl transferase component Bud32